MEIKSKRTEACDYNLNLVNNCITIMHCKFEIICLKFSNKTKLDVSDWLIHWVKKDVRKQKQNICQFLKGSGSKSKYAILLILIILGHLIQQQIVIRTRRLKIKQEVVKAYS